MITSKFSMISKLLKNSSEKNLKVLDAPKSKFLQELIRIREAKEFSNKKT